MYLSSLFVEKDVVVVSIAQPNDVADDAIRRNRTRVSLPSTEPLERVGEPLCVAGAQTIWPKSAQLNDWLKEEEEQKKGCRPRK